MQSLSNRPTEQKQLSKHFVYCMKLQVLHGGKPLGLVPSLFYFQITQAMLFLHI